MKRPPTIKLPDARDMPVRPDAIVRDAEGKLWFIEYKTAQDRGEFDNEREPFQIRAYRKVCEWLRGLRHGEES